MTAVCAVGLSMALFTIFAIIEAYTDLNGTDGMGAACLWIAVNTGWYIWIWRTVNANH